MTAPVAEPRAPEPTPEQRRRVRRTAVLLVLLAVGIYLGFIALNWPASGP